MHIVIIVVGVLTAIIIFVIRAQTAVTAARDLDYETRGLRRRGRHFFQRIFGTRLSRVRDPRLAATILMIQLVRTGSPVTAQEKTAILDNLAGPLGVENPQALFERAWSYTENRTFFSLVSDELLPLLRERLDAQEKQDLIDMLERTANAYSEASELQQGSLVHLKKGLFPGQPPGQLRDR